MKTKFIISLFIIIDIILFVKIFLGDVNFQLLNPQGPIAKEQKDLIFTAMGIMFVVAIPLLSFLYFFAYKYRAGGKASYKPDTKTGKFAIFIWWFIPSLFIFFLAIITWNKTHALDPYKPLESDKKPVRIQVVALQWKWLFIYPEENIATVNFIQFPEDTPINFELTAEAPMNSFWIPQLSGQIYAMTGMSTKLHIMADKTGDYRGQAAEINGRGFSGMKFIARASAKREYDLWVEKIKQEKNILDFKEYERLSKPSENHKPSFYSSAEEDLYNKIMMRFMIPSEEDVNSHMENMHH